MIPVHVGIMTSTPTVMMSSLPVVSKPAVPKKDHSAVQSKAHEESGPTTTVFVGNISEKASDMLIRQLLAVRMVLHRFVFPLHFEIFSIVLRMQFETRCCLEELRLNFQKNYCFTAIIFVVHLIPLSCFSTLHEFLFLSLVRRQTKLCV